MRPKPKTKQISQRVMSHCLEGTPSGPHSLYFIDAEIVYLDEGITVYLHTQWNDNSPDISFEATRESIYEIAKRTEEEWDLPYFDFHESLDEMQEIRDFSKTLDNNPEGRYKAQYEKLLSMMQVKANSDGVKYDFKTGKWLDKE